MTTLYVDDFYISPYAMYAWVGLKEKGVPFTTKTVALQSGEQKSSAFRDLAWTGKIPALEDAGFALTESIAILEYLEERYAFPDYPRLLPGDVQARAAARQMLNWLNSDLLGLRSSRPTTTIFYQPESKQMTEAAQNDSEKLLSVARRFLADGRPHLFGSWTIADTAFALMLTRLTANNDATPAYVSAYAKAQWNRPSVKAWRDHPRKPFIPYY